MKNLLVLPDCVKYLVGKLLNCKGEKRKSKVIFKLKIIL